MLQETKDDEEVEMLKDEKQELSQRIPELEEELKFC